MTDELPEDFEEEFSSFPPCFLTVAVYFVEKRFGGPEEGGWWYDEETFVPSLGEHLKTFPVSADADAHNYAYLLNITLVEELNKGRPPLSSVISEGRYRAKVCDELPRNTYPEERPIYS